MWSQWRNLSHFRSVLFHTFFCQFKLIFFLNYRRWKRSILICGRWHSSPVLVWRRRTRTWPRNTRSLLYYISMLLSISWFDLFVELTFFKIEILFQSVFEMYTKWQAVAHGSDACRAIWLLLGQCATCRHRSIVISTTARMFDFCSSSMLDLIQILLLFTQGTFLVRFSERTHQLVVSCHDPYLSRVRHVLVSATARGICWENVIYFVVLFHLFFKFIYIFFNSKADDTATGVYSSLDKLLEDYPDTYCRAQRRTFCESWAPPGTWFVFSEKKNVFSSLIINIIWTRFTGGDESSSESESDEPYGSVSMALRRVRERLNEQSDGAFSDSEVDDHPARHSSVKHLSSLACDSDSNQE